jgi:phosphatidylglycerophosphatase A
MTLDRKARSNESFRRLDPQILFLSFLGLGFSPYAPGTVGSLATLPILYAFSTTNAPFFFFIPFIILLTSISCYITDVTQKNYQLHDPAWIIIDEVIGMFIAWLFLLEHSLVHYALIFALFRFFDIIKFWPASYFDKEVKHGSGTILDDVISGIYAGVVYLILTQTYNYFL